MTFSSPKKSVSMMTEGEKRNLIQNCTSFVGDKGVPEAEIMAILTKHNWEMDPSLNELLD